MQTAIFFESILPENYKLRIFWRSSVFHFGGNAVMEFAMKTKALIKSQCERCGKIIYTTPIIAIVHRHTYRKYTGYVRMPYG